MKNLLKIIKKVLKWLLILIVILNILILISGKTYLYKGFANTYLQGRVSAGIDEYKIFDNRTVKAGVARQWAIAKDYNNSKIPSQYLSDMAKMRTIAYLVIKDDSIRHEEYWDGYSDTSHTSSFSMAKTFVSRKSTL